MSLRKSSVTIRLAITAFVSLVPSVACKGQRAPQVSWQDAMVAALSKGALPGNLGVEYPLDGTVFPPQIPAPKLLWRDESKASDAWIVRFDVPGERAVTDFVTEHSYRPSPEVWRRLQSVAPNASVRVTIAGVRREHPEVLLSGAEVAFVTSQDPVKAPIFFRQVPLPFDFANHHTEQIRYSLGTVEEDRPPRVLLEGLPVCGNCHSFDRDGRTLGMDVDYANDKGSYVVAPLEPVTHLTPERIITWSDYKRGDGQLTFGLLSQLSPDARYVMSTVKDRSIFVGLPERLEYSQLFFPIRGILPSTTGNIASITPCRARMIHPSCKAIRTGRPTENSSCSRARTPTTPTKSTLRRALSCRSPRLLNS